jgi:hypothetical protein
MQLTNHMVVEEKYEARGRPTPLLDMLQEPRPSAGRTHGKLFREVFLEDVELPSRRQP